MFPQKEDYPAFFGRYLDQISPETPLSQYMADSFEAHKARFRQMPEERLLHRYAKGKWSIKEVIGHLIDTERIMTYRALRFSRGDQTNLPGFDENLYVPAGKFDGRSIDSLLSEWDGVRHATMSLYEQLDEQDLARSGISNGNHCTANALFFIIAAHQEHHMNVIVSRYLD